MTREELRELYPQMAIINEPLVNCPKCKGHGQLVGSNPEKHRPCPCTIVTARPYDEMIKLLKSI